MANANDNTSTTTNSLNASMSTALDALLAEKFPGKKLAYTAQKATEKGDNYIGVIFRITVNIGSDENGNPFNLILKVPPENEAQRNQFFARSCFLRESLAYEEFLPLTAEYQLSKTIALHPNGFYEYATCYKSISEERNEAIFMEDLRDKQFERFDRFRELPLPYAALVMRAYGKLHAVSFALKKEQPQKLQRFQSLVDILEERKDNTHLTAYFEELKQATMDTLNSQQDVNYLNALSKYFEKSPYMELLIDLIHPSTCEPFAVVCHGDCWINNFLFKVENGVPVDVRLIDWQVMRYSTPICDLLYFIFACTTRKFRQQHFNELMDIYYTEFSNHLKRLGCDPEELFSRASFNEQLKKKGAVGLLMGMMILPITTMKSEDTPDLEKLCESIEKGDKPDLRSAGMIGNNNKVAYLQRMRNVIIDCIDYGYI